MIVLAGALVIAVCFLGWTVWQRAERVARELERTKLALNAANEEVQRIQADFANAGVIHDLWGMSSRFATKSAAACRADDDQKKVRTATATAVEMWSDSAVRAEIDLEGGLLPVLRGLEEKNVQVTGASLPAGVVAQYRRFRRDALGDVVMLDPSRIVDAPSRSAVLDLLRRASEGKLDPENTTVIYRLDEYGKISYSLVQGPADAPLLRATVSSDPEAGPVTITAADFPCS